MASASDEKLFHIESASDERQVIRYRLALSLSLEFFTHRRAQECDSDPPTTGRRRLTIPAAMLGRLRRWFLRRSLQQECQFIRLTDLTLIWSDLVKSSGGCSSVLVDGSQTADRDGGGDDDHSDMRGLGTA